MFCPKCNKMMIVVERNEVELDYCIQCNGFWLDKDEIKILAKKILQNDSNVKFDDLYALPRVKVKEGLRKCPVCGKNMDKIISHNIILDRCPNKDGIWFDKNEVSKLVNYSNNSDNNNTPINFLGEIFYGD